MKLLICTQAVDKNDPILGFFHRWILEFAKHFEHIHVICLKEGQHALPSNVSVYSLGKESGESRIKYIVRFYKHLVRVRGMYNRVFVHMNPHYVILGGLYWAVTRTPVFFWRNHARMNGMTEIAARFSRNVFYTSPFACTRKYAHSVQMPVGIDTTAFIPSITPPSDGRKILFLGRISPVKRVELFIQAGAYLPSGYELHIYGDAPRQDETYFAGLRSQAGENIFFHPPVSNSETPALYNRHGLYVNLTPEGSMDKTVLEATACGRPVIVTNKSFLNIVPAFSILTEATPEALAEKIVELHSLPTQTLEEAILHARNVVREEHSLERLGEMIHEYMER